MRNMNSWIRVLILEDTFARLSLQYMEKKLSKNIKIKGILSVLC